jgi:peptidoglycan DL-endopeptidase CwlO
VNGLEAVQARVAQLRSTLGILPPLQGTPPASSSSTTATSFASALADAVGQSATAPGSATGADAVSLARTFTGVPYRWGGSDPSTGLDCSGLTQLVYGRLGVELPRVAADQAHSGTAVPSIDQAQPGDLVFFGSPAHHVGIYVGGGKMIDAPHTGGSVGVHNLYGTPSAIRRVLSPSASATTGAGPGPAGVPYASLFGRAGARYGVDPALLAAVAKTESTFNPSAVSPAGAKGLMQLMPGTAASLGVDPLDPAQAVDGSARLLKQLLGRFDGRVDLALAGYNAGAGAVERYGGIPPYAETRTYVQRVTSAWEAYR